MMFPDLQSAPLVKVPGDGDLHRITCPYCIGGFAEVLVEKDMRANATRIENINRPVECRTCKRLFRLRPKVVLEGIKIGG